MKNSIYDITKFTTTDYENYIACVVWFTGCNMRCSYCYNQDIVNTKEGKYSLEDLYKFLKTRVGLLDAVVLSGGEATMHNLMHICTKIKQLGFKIKLDTNGSNPILIEKLLKNKLLDYVAVDFKAPKRKFYLITKSNFFDSFTKTIKIIAKSHCKYEIRTTLHRDLLDEYDINKMINILKNIGYEGVFYIQHFLEVPNLGKLKKSDNFFDETKIINNLKVSYRNS